MAVGEHGVKDIGEADLMGLELDGNKTYKNHQEIKKTGFGSQYLDV